MKDCWSNDEDATLRDMARDGYSSTQISQRIGRSRGAVIGRASRLGVRLTSSAAISRRQKRLEAGLPPARPRKSRAMSAEEKTARLAEQERLRQEKQHLAEEARRARLARLTEKAKKPELRRISVRQSAPPTSADLRCVAVALTEVGVMPLCDLKEHTCRWPFGQGASTTFCGKRRDENSPYCVAHKLVARFGETELKNMARQNGIAA